MLRSTRRWADVGECFSLALDIEQLSQEWPSDEEVGQWTIVGKVLSFQ